MITVRDFIPPFLISVARFLRKSPPERGLLAYPSYDDALKACRNSGYSYEKIIDVVEQKTISMKETLHAESALLADFSTTRALLVLALIQREKKRTKEELIKVIDVGGACGMHYFTIQKFFDDPGLRWYVVETPAMVNRATKAFSSQGIRFVSDIVEAKKESGKVDLLFSSGCLHYVPDPQGTLQSLIDCEAEYLYLSRIPVSVTHQESIFIQRCRLVDNGPGPALQGMPDEIVEFPITVISSDKLESILKSRYEILIRFNETDRFPIGDSVFGSYGCLARKR